jgi:hypothetical protein
VHARTPKVLSGFITSSVIIVMLGPDHACGGVDWGVKERVCQTSACGSEHGSIALTTSGHPIA